MATKQVIVLRKDLGMRKGKMIAQACHASLLALEVAEDLNKETRFAANQWRLSGTTKVVVSVDSEEELLKLSNAAREAQLPFYLVRDAGRTEFHGEPTYTACAIGPYWEENIDKITGSLKLL